MPTHPSKQTETDASSVNRDTTGGGGIRVPTEAEERKLREERKKSEESTEQQEKIELTPEEEEAWQRYLQSIRERRRNEQTEQAEEKEKRPFEDYTFSELIKARERAILEGDTRKANEIAREHNTRRRQRQEK